MAGLLASVTRYLRAARLVESAALEQHLEWLGEIETITGELEHVPIGDPRRGRWADYLVTIPESVNHDLLPAAETRP